jgi:hypothetical protein
MSDNMMEVQRIWFNYVAVLRSDLSVEIISRLCAAESKLTALHPNTVVDLHHVSHESNSGGLLHPHRYSARRAYTARGTNAEHAEGCRKLLSGVAYLNVQG